MVAVALVAAAVATYLAIVKLTGGTPACSIVEGCELINDSTQSLVLGIPIALLGVGASVATLGGALAWWRWADRRGLLVAYGIGLASLPVLAWLTYLEVAVIGAICVWCVSYAVLVVGGWIVATLVVVREGLTSTRSER
jgi:uncharacterized membrane protein